MAYPMDTNYYIVRATSNVDGTAIQDLLPAEFGNQRAKSQDALAIVMTCGCEDISWADHIAGAPRLDEFTFGAGDIPSYLSLGCENVSHADAQSIKNTTGASGSAWSKVQVSKW